jgi:hypothetical protein
MTLCFWVPNRVSAPEGLTAWYARSVAERFLISERSRNRRDSRSVGYLDFRAFCRFSAHRSDPRNGPKLPPQSRLFPYDVRTRLPGCRTRHGSRSVSSLPGPKNGHRPGYRVVNAAGEAVNRESQHQSSPVTIVRTLCNVASRLPCAAWSGASEPLRLLRATHDPHERPVLLPALLVQFLSPSPCVGDEVHRLR